MAGYLLRRILQSVIFVALASLAIYTALVLLMPDGPKARYDETKAAGRIVDGRAVGVFVQRGIKQYTIQEFEKVFKLDKPWPINYLAWLFDPADTSTPIYQIDGTLQDVPKGIDINLLGLRIRGSGLLTGTFGDSEVYAQNIPINELFGARWGHTAGLIALSIFITILVAIPLGIIGSIRHRTAVDHTITFASFAGLSVAPFVLGGIVVVFLSVLPASLRNTNGWSWLPFLPPGGVGSEDSWADKLWHMALPAATMALPQIAWLSRYTRFAMLEVLSQDYVRTAWAKGLTQRRVVLRHVLRNALLPLITTIGLALPGIASAAIVVETVFFYPGLGQLFYRALGGCLVVGSFGLDPPPCPRSGYFPLDFTLALSMTTIFVVIITLATLLADILYTAADPRVDLRARQKP